MPVDKPKPGETEEKYLAYCIPAEIAAGKEQDVAAAICYSYWREGKMSELKDLKKSIKELKNYHP